MRKLMMGFVMTLATSSVGSQVANATSEWSCSGAEYVCGSSASRSRAVDDEDRPARRAQRNEEGQPRKARSQRVASSRSSDDDAPVRRRKSVNSDSGGGSSYSGKASYYWEPQALASGGRFNPNAMTAAHKTLPFGTRVRVTNQNNGKSVTVTINDRGPYVGGRIIDLSKAAASAISMTGAGVASVTLAVLGR